MTKMITRIAIFLVALAVVGPTVLAQGGMDPQTGQLRRELDRTDELIMQAREAVRASDDALAAQALERAVEFQKAARTAYGNGAYVLAWELTKKAREQASVAISNSRMAGQLEGVVNSRLERSREMLDRARALVDGPLTPAMSVVYDQAQSYLAQAWQFYRRGQMRAAAKLMEQVEQSITRFQNMVRDYNQSHQEFEFRYENVLRMLEQAREMMGDCESTVAREQLERAGEAVQMARRMFGENQPEAALMALSRAREATRKATRECFDGQRLEERLRQLENEAARLEARLEGDTSEQARTAKELLVQAREQLRLARKYLGEDKGDQAMVALQAANLALRQAGRYNAGEN